MLVKVETHKFHPFFTLTWGYSGKDGCFFFIDKNRRRQYCVLLLIGGRTAVQNVRWRLTHGCRRQRLSPNKLGGSHPVEEVAELRVRCQTHAAVVETAERVIERVERSESETGGWTANRPEMNGKMSGGGKQLIPSVSTELNT